jgi:subtilisin family serine protease
VNWQCRLVALKFLGADGSGFTSDAVEAVQYVIDNNIKVSNNSWGGGGFSQALYDTIEAAQAVGHIFVAAAGNSLCGINNDSSPHYPSSYDLANIISVAAIDNDDRITGFSMYGLSTVDLGAPGDDTYSTWLGSTYKYARGTSMATPHVTGVVALVQSKNPS